MPRPAAIGFVLIFAWVSQNALAQEKSEQVKFGQQILPILSDKCFVCHGPDASDPDLVRLDSFAGATNDLGGYAAIDPQHLDRSEILNRIQSADDPMPPADAVKQLTDNERELLQTWIRQGGIYEQHWAFVPPARSNAEQPARDAIDAHVSRQFQSTGIDFAPAADRRTVARRAALVLTGLPPAPSELNMFLEDHQPGAFSRFVEKLLANPQFGEHQARYWLDAVRYGDTHGLHLDNRRGIYPYRDWVVRVHNQNLPLNDFVTWQLAGDLLPNPTLEQRVATGFIRLNPSTSEGGVIPAEFQAKNNFDRTETFGTVFLGMSLTCARCHNHKYDPITQTEYYQLLAFFNSTAEPALDGNSYTYGTFVKAPADQQAWADWSTIRAARTKLVDAADQNLAEFKLNQEQQQAWQAADEESRLALLAETQGPFSGWSEHAFARVTELSWQKAAAEFTTTLVAGDLPKPRETRLLQRGEYNLPTGDVLQPDVIQVMGSLPAGVPRNRLGLARWLTSREHPLTSRVLVNQLWQRVFGIGLVRTPEDFGVQGQRPTHPELLDWLAVELQDSGWDLKHMLREMVMSRTFRQSSARRPTIDDPANLLFARGPSYRLDAEVLRDIGLWASQLLDPKMGGEGVKPYQPPGMWLAMAHPASNTKNYVRDKGSKLYRRSLYVYWKRTSPHPMMTLFDAPSRESSCVYRATTNTSLQSLALLNEVQRVEMARKLAERLVAADNQDPERLNLLYALLTSRRPNQVELEACLSLLENARRRFKADQSAANQLLSLGDAPRNNKLDAVDVAAWTQVATVVLASDAAISLY